MENEKVLKEFLRTLLNQHIGVMVWEYSRWSNDKTTLRTVIEDISENTSEEINKQVVNVVCEFLGTSPDTLVDTWDETIKQ